MSALGSAISGLQSSQKWLDVISNNVSNSNTIAYKQGRLTFSDMISDGLRAPSGPNNTSNLGGINPTQLGLGVTVGSIQTIMKQGALQTTGNVTDVAINGTGFLTVAKGANTLYTRAGNLTFDQQGNLVTADGGLVQGWSASINRTGVNPALVLTGPTLATNNPAAVGNIQIPNNLVIAPKATSVQTNEAVKDQGVILKGNLDNRTPLNPAGGTGYAFAGFIPDATTTFTVYDTLGTAYTLLASFEQTNATPGFPASWTMHLNDITGGAVPNTVAWVDGGPGNMLPDSLPITFNADGSLAVNGSAAAGLNITVNMAPKSNGSAPMQFTINLGTDTAGNPGGTPPLGLRDGLTGDFGNGSFDAFGNYQAVQGVYTQSVDGYSEGTLLGLSFNQTGGVDANFSNGITTEVAKLALTKFDNQDGLSRVGGNYFQKTSNSGLGQVGVGGSNGFGTILGGAVESSNVDLTVELTNMILAQRMFESNARVVTSADKVLDTLVNLGR
jgi:flagellar hook protein FlgE